MSIPSAKVAVFHLNNEGSNQMLSGDYEKAIPTLLGALKIWEQSVSETRQRHHGDCCSLDESIKRARSVNEHISEHDSLLPCEQSTPMSVPSMSKFPLSEAEETNNHNSFIYQKPIFVCQDLMIPDQAPGVGLSLIVILNLAMAHQLRAMQQPGGNRTLLRKSLQLYELAHQLLLEEDISSPRATLIISNNVGEIHKAVGNEAKHEVCLQHLLSTLMYMIDCGVSSAAAELEGFFRNTSQLILHNNCAGAA